MPPSDTPIFDTLAPDGDGIACYLDMIQRLQRGVIESQAPLLKALAQRMAQAVLDGRRIFVFGTGHSHLLAGEAYCRAGGIATVVPIFYTALMLHENIPAEALIERTPGLAAPLLDAHKPKSGEMIVIFSNSGVNQVPVEMAVAARERGLVVVTVSSYAFAAQAPRSTIGKRLDELADFAIDNGGVPGDAMIGVGGDHVGPSSTVVGATLWNCLVVEVARLLHTARGGAPIFVSQNMQGGLEHNAAIVERWGSK